MKLFPLLAGFELEGVGTSWGWVAFWVALAVGAFVFLAATYRGIFRRSERRLTWLLMLLRGVGLAALLLALARPSWTGERQLVDAGHVGVVLDNSRSMSLADPSGRTRYAWAVEAVGRLRRALEAGGAKGRLVVDLFDINGEPLPGNQAPAEPAVGHTDLTAGLAAAAERLRFHRLNGLVLVSDGADTTGTRDFKQFARSLGVPVYAAGFAKEAGGAADLDLALEPVRQPPARVLVNNDVRVDVRVTKSGGPKVDAVVSVRRGLRERLAEKKVSLPAGDAEQTVGLTLRPAEAGTFQLTALVESPARERNLANNSWRFPLRVDADAIRVLYLEGFLRHEYTFLKRRLEDDPDLNVAPLVRRVNPEQAGPAGGKGLLTPARLKNFDVVILGDMEAGYLGEAEVNALAAWLDQKDRDRGSEHSLLVLGGYRSFGPDGFRKTRLADVLPVVFADRPPYQSETPFRMRLTEEGRGHPIFAVSGDRVQTEQAWEQAPPLAGCSLVRRAKPAAQVLAVNPAVIVDGKPAVVAAVQRYGAGHTMVLTADTTWRWSRFARVLGRSDTLYARFWSQAVRWLAGRTVNNARPPLVVSTDRLDYYPGRPVTVTVRRQSGPQRDLSNTRLRVWIAKAGRKDGEPVAMRPDAADPDQFTGTFSRTAGGEYEVMATLSEGGKVLANRGTAFRVYDAGREVGPQADTGTYPERLEEMARAGGGAYRDVGQAEELAELIPRRPRVVNQTERVEYWNRGLGPVPALFLVFIGAVSVEWVIRRRNHLV